MISTLTALRCLPGRHVLRPHFPIFADFQIAPNSRVAARLVAPCSLHVVLGREVADRCLGFCALYPIKGQTLMSLMSYSGVQIAAELLPEIVGLTLGEARAWLPNAILMGILPAASMSEIRRVAPISCAPLLRTFRKMGAKVVKKSTSIRSLKHLDVASDVASVAGEAIKYVHIGKRQRKVEQLEDDDSLQPDMSHLKEDSSLFTGSLFTEKERRIEKGDRVIMLVHTASEALPEKPDGLIKQVTNIARELSSSDEKRGRRGTCRSGTQYVSSLGVKRDACKDSSADPRQTMTSDVGDLDLSKGGRPIVVLLVGWSRDTPHTLQVLSRSLPKNSEVYILSERTISWRCEQLVREGYTSSWSAGSHPSGCERSPERGFSEDLTEDDTLDEEGQLREGDAGVGEWTMPQQVFGFQVRHRVGITTDTQALQVLPIIRAHIAIVVADSDRVDGAEASSGGVALQRADAEVLISSDLLYQIAEQRDWPVRKAAATAGGRATTALKTCYEGVSDASEETVEVHARQAATGMMAPALTIISEFNDMLTRRLLRQPTALGVVQGTTHQGGSARIIRSVAFQRSFIETAALSMSSFSPMAWYVIQSIISPASSSCFHTICVGDVLPHLVGERLSFHVLSAYLNELPRKENLGTLIGWERASEHSTLDTTGTHLGYSYPPQAPGVENRGLTVNPLDKDAPLLWTSGDVLITFSSLQVEPSRLRHVDATKALSAGGRT